MGKNFFKKPVFVFIFLILIGGKFSFQIGDVLNVCMGFKASSVVFEYPWVFCNFSKRPCVCVWGGGGRILFMVTP